MHSLCERVLAKENAQFGLIAIRSANIFVGPPLTQLSFNGNITGNGGNCRILSAPTICSIDCAALSHDERTIAYSTSTAVKLVDLNTGREMRTLVGQNGRINNVTQSNKSIYSWASVSSDCTITIWDTRQHPANVLTRRLDRSANCLLFSPNDAFIAIGSDQLYMMDPRIRDMRSLPTSSQVLHVCFHPSYYLLATGSDDRLVRFWDIESEECVSKSEPSDGALKKIAFQNDGSLLFTLTDRRCGAICWEPFEVLGQCFLTDSNRSLTLTSNDSDVLLLAHSTVTNKISLSSLPIAELLSEEFSKAESISIAETLLERADNRRVNKEQGGNEINIETLSDFEANNGDASGSSSFDEAVNGDPFVPKKTLPRTPPQRRSPVPSRTEISILPPEEKFLISVPTRMQLPRPKSLKTTKRETNSKISEKILKNRMGSIAASRSSQSPLGSHKQANGNISHTCSAPDVRCNPRKKPLEKEKEEKTSRNINQKKEITLYETRSSESKLINRLVHDHEKLEQILLLRQRHLESALQCWRSRGFEAAINEASRANDNAVLVELIDAINHSPSLWSLTICASVLPHIELLIAHKNEDFTEVALASLRTIICGCGEIIRNGSQRSSIGVDVTADERHSKCLKCMQQLTSLRVKASLLTAKMNSNHLREFNALMQILDENFSL